MKSKVSKARGKKKVEKVEKAPQEAVTPSPKPEVKEDPKAGWPDYCRHLSVSAYTRWLAYLEEQRVLLASKGVDPALDMGIFLKTWMLGGKGMNEARTYAKLRISHPDPAQKEEAAASAE